MMFTRRIRKTSQAVEVSGEITPCSELLTQLAMIAKKSGKTHQSVVVSGERNPFSELPTQRTMNKRKNKRRKRTARHLTEVPGVLTGRGKLRLETGRVQSTAGRVVVVVADVAVLRCMTAAAAHAVVVVLVAPMHMYLVLTSTRGSLTPCGGRAVLVTRSHCVKLVQVLFTRGTLFPERVKAEFLRMDDEPNGCICTVIDQLVNKHIELKKKLNLFAPSQRA
jgi:hypothetical protein